MNESIYKKLRDFAEGLAAVTLAAALTILLNVGEGVEIKVLLGMVLTGALTAASAYARWWAGVHVLPLLKEIATRPVNR